MEQILEFINMEKETLRSIGKLKEKHEFYTEQIRKWLFDEIVNAEYDIKKIEERNDFLKVKVDYPVLRNPKGFQLVRKKYSIKVYSSDIEFDEYLLCGYVLDNKEGIVINVSSEAIIEYNYNTDENSKVKTVVYDIDINGIKFKFSRDFYY